MPNQFVYATLLDVGTRVYAYGCLKPRREDLPGISDQLRKAHAYYNKLIEIERARRKAEHDVWLSDPAMAQIEGSIATLEGQLEEILTQMRALRAAAREKVDMPPEDKKRMSEIRAMLKHQRQELKAKRKEVGEREEIKDALAAVREGSKENIRAAREACGVYWGTYLLIEQAFDAARKAPTEPKFRRWMGEGLLGVQFQKGLAVPGAFKNDPRFQIAPVTEEAWSHPSRSERDRKRRTQMKFRIGSVGRAPLWSEWPIVYHRPLPEDGTLKWAKIVVRRHANWSRYELQLTVETPDPPPPQRPGIVGLDFGWRKMDDGSLRVAYWKDDRREGEVRLPPIILEKFAKAEHLQSVRDTLFDQVRAALSAADRSVLDPEIQERLETIAHWKSTGRLHAVRMQLKDKRKEGDQAIWDIIEPWHHRDRHLEQYQVGVRTAAIRYRREIYRLFARQIADTYGTVVIEDWDLRTVTKRDPLDTNDSREPMHQRFIAALSSLRQILENAVAGQGGIVMKVDPAYTTLQCSACGLLNEWNAASSIKQQCQGCLKVWDQDANAANNFLVTGKKVIEEKEAELAAPKEKRKAKWHKRHTKEAEAESPPEAVS